MPRRYGRNSDVANGPAQEQLAERIGERRTVSLVATRTVPYRCIGAVIYALQSHGHPLVTFRVDDGEVK